MGRVKEAWMQSQERGWDAPDTFVCSDCVEDDFLKQEINDNLGSRKCSYCGRGSHGYIAAPVEAIMPSISAALHYYYNDPESACVRWDKGYVVEPDTSTEEALYNISLICHDDLFTEIAGSFHNDMWIETAEGFWAGIHLSESLQYDWDRFVRTVKHECRYFFSSIKPQDDWSDELSPIALLSALGAMILDLELLRVMPSDTHLYRVRMRDSSATRPFDIAQLGPPPNEKANAGRMNPAGISYFYLAQDNETAFAEVINKPPSTAVIADFKTNEDLLLLNLCDLPPIPSIFDAENHRVRELLYFLINFIKEITQPIEKNGKEHIDYVASQIISEYFAKEFRTPDRQHLHGVAYPSAIRPGGINIVLFPPQEDKEYATLVDLSDSEEITFNTWDDLMRRLS